VQVTVAGQKVSVTAYWQPNYVYFSGQALIVPPQTGASIVLKYEPQTVGPILYANGQATATTTFTCPSNAICATPTITQGSATGQSSPATPATQAPSSQSVSAQTPSSGSDMLLISGGAAAISLAALGVALLALRSKPKPVVGEGTTQ
jgi:hypothetical protein